MSAFKVGDRVRFTATAGTNDVLFGCTGVIFDTHDVFDWRVKLDVRNGGYGHSCDGDVEDGYGRYANSSDLELVPVAEATGTLTIRTGRYYKTRDGRKVGPASVAGWAEDFEYRVGGNHYNADGSHFYGEKNKDLVAEWVDELAVAPATAKFKVGDRVENAIPKNDYDKPGTVTEVTDEGYRVHWDNDPGAFSIYWYDNELRLVAPATSGNAIVALIENGQPKPSHRPYVHASREAAETEATRLAGKHPGKEFGVYELVATKREAKAYDFEWQRLAAGGQKIAAIKSLRGITGLISLRSAKTAVEDFLDREAA